MQWQGCRKSIGSNMDKKREPARATRFTLRMAIRWSVSVANQAISHEEAQKATRDGANQQCLPHGETPKVQGRREGKRGVELEREPACNLGNP